MIEDGFRVGEIDGVGFKFKFEGGTYYIDTDPKDEMYLRIGFPGFWIISADVDRFRALEVASKVSESMKAVKVYMHQEAIHCTTEQFMVSVEQLPLILPRCLAAMQGAARRFAELMQSGAPDHG